LVTNYGLGYALSLLFGCPILLQLIEREVAAIEFE
jgi:hypothetical protein